MTMEGCGLLAAQFWRIVVLMLGSYTAGGTSPSSHGASCEVHLLHDCPIGAGGDPPAPASQRAHILPRPFNPVKYPVAPTCPRRAGSAVPVNDAVLAPTSA